MVVVPVTSDALWVRTSCLVKTFLHSTKSHLIIGGIFYSSSRFGDSWRGGSLVIFFSFLHKFLFFFLWLDCFPVAFITTAGRTWHFNTKLEHEDTTADNNTTTTVLTHTHNNTKNPAGLWALSREPFQNKIIFIYRWVYWCSY